MWFIDRWLYRLYMKDISMLEIGMMYMYMWVNTHMELILSPIQSNIHLILHTISQFHTSVSWYIRGPQRDKQTKPTHCLHAVNPHNHLDVIMSTMASQITSLTSVYSTIYLGADHREHQSSASLAFLREIHQWPVNSRTKGSGAEKNSFDDVIMIYPQPIYRMPCALDE